MRKTTTLLILAAAVLMVLSVPTLALANFGPHGGYVPATEECAGCHRAHTAPSTITWQDLTPGGSRTRSALLLSTASNLESLCLACHDSALQGAYTNVVDGVYTGTVNGVHNGDMISGAFGRPDTVGGVTGLFTVGGDMITSTHVTNGTGWAAYGGGTYGSSATDTAHANGDPDLGSKLGAGNQDIFMDCGTCHDPHGSSNYRLLKDMVYGVSVGGYTTPDGPGTALDPIPAPFVISHETGFPSAGFPVHQTVAQLGYVPNYTTAKYSVAPTSVASPNAPDPTRGMSGWCVSCHTTYMTEASQYDSGDGYGYTHVEGSDPATPTIRHRHPINVALSTFAGPRPLNVNGLPVGVPLAHADAGTVNGMNDWVECLTCHNSHGASSAMTGWANVEFQFDAGQLKLEADSGEGGVAPTNDSALLRLDNRTACEACHYK